jgi:carbon-monoxide dehydrogenase medium subunit
MVRHRAIERSAVVHRANPLLAHAVGFIGHSAIRNRGTIGGSIAHADPAAELPAVLLILDGAVEVRGARGTRTIPAAALFEGFLTTSLAPDELLTAIKVPAWAPGTGWSFQEFSRRSGDFAIVGVAATLQLDDKGNVGQARLAFSGVDQVPVRATAAESLLAGATPSDELWKSAAQAAAAPLEPASDIHGSAAYRTHLAATLAERALREAHDRARDAR